MTTSTSGSLGAVNVTSGSVLADHVEWAGTSGARRSGLLGRPDLPVGHGLYLVPCQWIHMFGMRFAIDVLFLDSAGVVIALHHSLRPNRFSRLVLRAEGVLELPARTLESTGTHLGDTVCFVGNGPKSEPGDPPSLRIHNAKLQHSRGHTAIRHLLQAQKSR